MIYNVENILSYFSKIRRGYANQVQLTYKEHRLTPNEISVLILLSNNQSIDTARELSLFLGVSKSLVSRSVDSLLSLGILSCKKDEKDKRISHLELTKESEILISNMTEEMKKVHNSILKSIPKVELEQMEETMLKIIQCLKEMEE